MGRKTKNGTRVNFYIKKEANKILDSFSEEMGIPRSVVIERLIINCLGSKNDNKTPKN